MHKKSRDILCLFLTGALGVFSLGTLVVPRRTARAWEGSSSEPLSRVTVIEPDSPEIIEQRRLEEERAREAERLAEQKKEFIKVWGERIDAFNEGWPLAGYGETFAEAAYVFGLDPRFAPAIARQESGSGTDCFLPYNAWGWHGSQWTSWESAIWGYSHELAEGYGYTISYAGAAAYNNVSTDLWYSSVSSFMYEIWPNDLV